MPSARHADYTTGLALSAGLSGVTHITCASGNWDAECSEIVGLGNLLKRPMCGTSGSPRTKGVTWLHRDFPRIYS